MQNIEVYEKGTFVYPENAKGDVWPDAVACTVAFPGRDRFHSKVYYKYMHFKNYNTYTEYLRGDVNKDGVVNVTDVIRVAYYAKTRCGHFAPDEFLLADANYDGEIDSKDTDLIASIVKGKF